MKNRNIGIIATRLNSTDGVSLEAAKWVQVLQNTGYTCYFFAGELAPPLTSSMYVELAHFKHRRISKLSEYCFSHLTRSPHISKQIHVLMLFLKSQLYAFTKKFDIGILLAENTLSIPMNIPLGLALTEFIAETGIPTLAHHHDLYWERTRFLRNCIGDYLSMGFPPNLPSVKHIVISSAASNQLSLRTGVSPLVIPNVMDFDNPSQPSKKACHLLKKTLGLDDQTLFILQPTRVVSRKGIEHSIELLSRLHKKAVLVISHNSGDEQNEYEKRLKEYSKLLNVTIKFASHTIKSRREKGYFLLEDFYHAADFVTYPSNFEGFGNAFLEAIYYKKNIMVNTYSTYTVDIKPKGFRVIEMKEHINQDVIREVHRIFDDPLYAKDLAEINFELGKKHYSFKTLAQRLKIILEEIG